MGLSLQRLGDDPRDHDAAYIPLRPDLCDVARLRPDMTETQWEEMVSYASSDASMQCKAMPWKVYPPPPPPHWHPNLKDEKPSETPQSRKHVSGHEEFDFAECDIPGADEWEYALDEKGVFQVYASKSGMLRDVMSTISLPLMCSQILHSRSLTSKYLPFVNISWTWTIFSVSYRMAQRRATLTGELSTCQASGQCTRSLTRMRRPLKSRCASSLSILVILVYTYNCRVFPIGW
jgi:hypothetical protein